jgi:hypothetical protein
MGDGNYVLKTVVLHESGESMEGCQPVLSAKADAQSMGSALTYARRYGLCAALGLVSGDEDDDGNAASQVKSRSTPSKGVTAPPKPSGGATNPSIEEQVSAAPHLGALQTLMRVRRIKSRQWQKLIGKQFYQCSPNVKLSYQERTRL